MPQHFGAQTNANTSSLFDPQEFLGADPELTFFSFQDQFGRGGNQQKFFQGQFNEILNKFRGNLGAQLQQGNIPTNTFNDFLGGFNFDEQFGSMAPSVRGAQTSRFAPLSRFIDF
jgi:hypothetical protein